MELLWQDALWLLLALPMLAGAYLAWLRRTNRAAVRYTSARLVREAMTRADYWRPHVPPLVFFAGIALLLLAVARPAIYTRSPAAQATVVLLMDVSLSMAASDVRPTRLDAARAAAKRFVDAQPRDVHIGVVAFGGHADVVQAPTGKRKDVIAALDALELQRFTAIGNGLIGALLTIVPDADIPQGYDIFGMGRLPAGPPAGAAARKAVPRAPEVSAAIILVGDGRGTMGVPARQAAKLVAAHGVRVYTVGVGTLYGGVANIEGWPAIHAEFEEETLKDVASITGGEYFLARNADRLATIYERLGRRTIFENGVREITVILTAIGMLCILASAALSLLWRTEPTVA